MKFQYISEKDTNTSDLTTFWQVVPSRLLFHRRPVNNTTEMFRKGKQHCNSQRTEMVLFLYRFEGQ